MPALIKLGSQPNKLGITSLAREFITSTNDLMGLRMKHGKIVRVGGKEDGQAVEGQIIEANQQVLIYPAATISPVKYQVLVSINPALLKNGMFSHPHIIQPGEGEDIVVAYKAGRRTDLAEIDYMFNLYMVD